ncbi:MAG: hypothetical protein ACTSUY_12670 [Alphaproteobacteria bacterium]
MTSHRIAPPDRAKKQKSGRAEHGGQTPTSSTLDELWEVLPPQISFHGKKPRRCEELILHELIEMGEVDCDKIVQIVQLMAIAEFGPFFQALCNVDLKNPSQSADRLARCALRLGPKPLMSPSKKYSRLAVA